ncbi:SpoIIE family protein phosphatase [Streptomyces sp. NPDC051940]|uniref:SpoIIE family protein phosphatase n=1 Tax=Streptomyces sp. NPDC051940 TaxID=3155675 RepID=UPI0034424C73
MPESSGARDAHGDAGSPRASPADQDPLGSALLRALFTQVPVSLYVLDDELRLVRAGRHGPAGPGEMVAAPPEWASPRLGGSKDVTGMLQDVLRTGDPVVDAVLPDHGLPVGGQVLSASVLRLEDTAGGPIGLVVAVRDTTVRHRAQQRLRLLHRASGRVGTTLDVFRTAQELAEAAVPHFAGGAAVDILDSVVHGDAPAPGPVVDVSVRRAGFAWADERVQEGAFPIGAVRIMRLGTPLAQSLADVRPRLVRELRPDDPWLVRDPARARLLRFAGAHSLLTVPMVARGVVLGLAAFYRCRDEPAFDDDDVALATELVERAALAVDNARRFTREHTIAGLLQRTLVPMRLPAHTAVRTAHTYLPVASGGTWYDVLPLSGARVGLVVGEVVGRGLRAVTAMGRLRTAVATLAALDMDPGELMGRVHDLTVQLGNEQADLEQEAVSGTADPDTVRGTLLKRDPADGLGEVTGLGELGEPEELEERDDLAEFDDLEELDEHAHRRDLDHDPRPLTATCLFAVYDPVTGECTLARAGHSAPVIVPPGEPARAAPGGPGPALGRGEAVYPVTTFDVPPDSVLALHSTALTRAVPDGAERAALIGTVVAAQAAGSLQEACDAAVTALLPERPARDDVLLLLARTRVLGPGQVGSWTLPPQDESASAARQSAVRQLAEWGLEQLTPTVELVVSELVTNAVRYSTGPIELRLIRDDSLVCEVSDTSSASPHQRHASADDEGGRGLFLVSQLAGQWGIRHHDRGKTVWAALPLP